MRVQKGFHSPQEVDRVLRVLEAVAFVVDEELMMPCWPGSGQCAGSLIAQEARSRRGRRVQ
nr:hypothetical protein [Gammaproteobacteria bacterium]